MVDLPPLHHLLQPVVQIDVAVVVELQMDVALPQPGSQQQGLGEEETALQLALEVLELPLEGQRGRAPKAPEARKGVEVWKGSGAAVQARKPARTTRKPSRPQTSMREARFEG